MDRNIYKKVGRRYVPIGMLEPERYLTDGIWLVRHKPSGTSRTNLAWISSLYGFVKVGDIPPSDFTAVAKMERYADAVARVLDENGIPPVGICLQDLARRIVSAMYEVNGKEAPDKSFDEILESNRDVLRRIKEKGD